MQTTNIWIIVAFALWLFCISIMDIRSCRVPVKMLCFGGILAILTLAFRYYSGELEWFDMLKGVLPGILLLIIAFATKKAGYGDGIVLLILGPILGEGGGLLVFGISLLLISVWSLILLVLRKAGRNTRIPYMPFVATAWLAVMIL